MGLSIMPPDLHAMRQPDIMTRFLGSSRMLIVPRMPNTVAPLSERLLGLETQRSAVHSGFETFIWNCTDKPGLRAQCAGTLEYLRETF